MLALMLLLATPKEFSEGYKRAATSGLTCEVLVKSLKVAQDGKKLKFDCAKKKVCEGKTCEPLDGAVSDSAFAVQTRKDLASALEDRKGKTCDQIKTWFESWHLGDNLRQPFRYDCKWRLMCSVGGDGEDGTDDDVCYPMP
jgi:hypothetical protein